MTTSTVTVLQIEVDTPSILGDERPDADDSFLASVYVGQPFIIDLIFTLTKTDGDVPETLAINEVVVTLPAGISGVLVTVIDPSPSEYHIRLSGSVTGGSVGAGESYRFVLDGEGFPVVTTIPTQTPNDFLAIVEWTTPSVTSALLTSYNFLVKAGSDSGTYDMQQYVYWNWQPALIAFEQLVPQGRL